MRIEGENTIEDIRPLRLEGEQWQNMVANNLKKMACQTSPSTLLENLTGDVNASVAELEPPLLGWSRSQFFVGRS